MYRPGVFKQSENKWVDRGWYLVSEFEQTNSKNFQKALALAQKSPGFTKLMDERNVLIYRNLYRPENLIEFEELYSLIRTWRNTRVYIRGEEVNPTLFNEGVACYIKTKLRRWSYYTCQSFDEKEFKLGYLGCFHSGVTLDWIPGASTYFSSRCWFYDGVLNSRGVYVIQKEEIYQRALGGLMEYQHCPLLDLKALSALINRLPDSINPHTDKEWKYTRNPRFKRVLRGNSDFEEEYHLPPVIPISEVTYQEYMKRILKK